MEWMQFLQIIAVPIGLAVFYAMNEKAKGTQKEVDVLRDDLHNFKLSASQTYSTRVEMKEMEGRILNALDRVDLRVANVQDIFAKAVRGDSGKNQ